MSTVNRRPAVGKENVKNGHDATHAKSAPDFSKLHKQWDKKLQKGGAVKKKPLTSIQPFQLSQASNRANVNHESKSKFDAKSNENIRPSQFSQATNHTKIKYESKFKFDTKSNENIQPFQLSQATNHTKLNYEPKFKFNTKSKENVVNCNGTVDNAKSATTLRSSSATSKSGIPRFSKLVQPESGIPRFSKLVQPAAKPVVATGTDRPTIVPNVVKPVIVKDVTQPAVRRSGLPQLSQNVKKTKPIQDFKVEFKCDKSALDSILNGEGIDVLSNSPSRLSTRFGPAKKDHSKNRVAPFQKPGANINCPSDRTRIVPANQEVVNAAKRRWSIYNRDSFSTKVDLMTWLKQLAGVPNNTSTDNCSSVSSNSLSVVHTSVTNSVNVTSSMDNESTACYSVLSDVTTGYKAYSSRHAFASSLSNTSTQDSISKFQHSSVVSFSKPVGSSSTFVLGGNSLKYNDSAVGDQSFDQHTEVDIRRKDERCPTFVTPTRNHTNLAKSKPTATKSILKKSSLPCIEEVDAEKGTDKKNTMINMQQRMKEIRTPLRGNKSVPKVTAGVTPVKSVQRKPTSNMKEQIKPVRALANNVTKTRTPTRSPASHKKRSEKSCQNIDNMICLDNRDCDGDIPCGIMDNAAVKDSYESFNKKHVHWNTDLTYLSPVDVSTDDLLNEGVSTLHRKCAVKLFCDDTLIDQTSPECIKTMASNVKVPQNCIASSAVMINQETIVSKSSLCRGRKATTSLFNDIGASCNGLVPTRSVTSHQIKYIIPAEQPLEKSQSGNEEKEIVKNKSWADILGNMSPVSAINQITEANSVSSDMNLFFSIPNCSLDMSTQKDQSTKSRHFNILDKIYGDTTTSLSFDASHNSVSKKPNDHSTSNKSLYNTKPAYNVTSVMYSNAGIFRYEGCGNNRHNNRRSIASQCEGNISHPSTLVTYTQNGRNVLYGDSNDISVITSENTPAKSSPFALISFSSEKKNGKCHKEQAARNGNVNVMDESLLPGETSFLLGTASVGATPVGPRDESNHNSQSLLRPVTLDKYVTSFLSSPVNSATVKDIHPLITFSVERKDGNFIEGHSSSRFALKENKGYTNNPLSRDASFLLGTPTTSLYLPNVSLPLYSQKGMSKHKLNQNPPQSLTRPVDLDNYVTSLNQSNSSNVDLCRSHLEKSRTIETMSSNVANHSFLNKTDDSNDSYNLDLSDSDVCMVFSTPFKRGLYDHILQTNSYISIHKDIQVEATKRITTTPTQKFIDLHHSKTSTFRHIHPPRNVSSKNIVH